MYSEHVQTEASSWIADTPQRFVDANHANTGASRVSSPSLAFDAHEGAEDEHVHLHGEGLRGKRVLVEGKGRGTGTIIGFKRTTGLSTEPSKHEIKFDNGQTETLVLARMRHFKYVGIRYGRRRR